MCSTKERKHNKELNKVLKLKNIMTELKNSREFQQQPGQSGRRISMLKDRTFEIIQSEEQTEKKNEKRLSDLWYTFKRNNLYIIEVSAESLFKEIMTGISPNLGRDLDNQIHEANS